MQTVSDRAFPFLLTLFLLMAAACDSTEPPEEQGPGEEELITRIVLTISGGGQTILATAEDEDGDGANFQIGGIRLTGSTTYTGSVQLFDDINDVDLTAEVREEGTEHQFFYTLGGPASEIITLTTTDTDANGLPLGLSFRMVVGPTDGSQFNGTFNVVLSHFDREPKTGTTRSSETDVDVTFPVIVE